MPSRILSVGCTACALWSSLLVLGSYQAQAEDVSALLRRAEQLENRRMFAQAADAYRTLVDRELHSEAKAKFTRNMKINQLFHAAKQQIIEYVNNAGGVHTAGLGRVRELSLTSVVVAVRDNTMAIPWARLSDREYMGLMKRALRSKTTPELAMACAILLLRSGNRREADTYLRKARSLNPSIEKEFIGMFGAVKERKERKDKTAHVSVTFEPTDEDILNPERGFYRGASLVPPRDQSRVREQGYTLVMSYVRLDAYRDSDIPKEFLDDVDNGFEQMRKAGLKVILRFAYNHDRKGQDASREWVLKHLDQLKPMLQRNMDVIAVLQAGFIGAWGEWHSSVHKLDTPENRKDILMKILEVLPAERMVQVRCPRYKEEIFGRKLRADEAFSGTPIARVGHHNDCFLASDTDAGTYARPKGIEYWKSYIEQEGRYTPGGGETCRLGGKARVSCENALRELARLHWSYLNSGYHPGALEKLKTEGCMLEIRKRLGYRFVLEKLTVSNAVSPGDALRFHLELRNDGFASPYNRRPVYVVLVRKGAQPTCTIPVESADPRVWLPGQTHHVQAKLKLPGNLPRGTYALYLWLPDASERLRAMPAFAIRMANKDVWQPDTGYNLLCENLRITDK